MSTTLLVKKDAPTVDCVVGGVKAFFTYRWTREVFPTPWLPRTTIFASRLLDMTVQTVVTRQRCLYSSTVGGAGVGRKADAVGSTQVCAVPRSQEERKCVVGGRRTSCMACSEDLSPATVRRGRELT
ncbi:hypothetical protein IG631_02717 [Alternaria alternata]|nr:hypothetical protein IG631_02717 [Alternaria alternata]